MALQAVIEVSERKTEEAMINLIFTLLEKGIIDALLTPKELPSKDGFVQTLIRDYRARNGIKFFSPTMPVQSARIVSNLTVKNLGKKVGVILKPCEIRAVVELVKFLQVKLDDIYLIGIDCPGTFEVWDYAKMVKEGLGDGKLERELMIEMERGEVNPPEGYKFRTACEMCEYNVPSIETADIIFKLYGYKSDQKIGVEIGERLEKEIEGKGILSFSDENASRQEVIKRVTEERTKRRDELFRDFKEMVKDLPSFLNRFSTCIRCHNCMVSCPICYCKECVFRTAVFEHEGDQYLRWADRKGGIRMPTDTLIFHLIRMTHMVTSCVGCGLCDSACPSRLPVATLFRSVGDKVQKMFGYLPGRDLKEVPPVATFKEDELKIESGAI